MDLERIIANRLANIPDGPSRKGQAVENMDELVFTAGTESAVARARFPPAEKPLTVMSDRSAL